jgi:hypothetical protein
LKEFGVFVEFGVELVTFVQDDSGVSITSKHAADQKEEKVMAKYIVGADDARGKFPIVTSTGSAALPLERGDAQAGGRPLFGRVEPEFSMVIGEVELSGLDRKACFFFHVQSPPDWPYLPYSQHWHQFRMDGGQM